ncbi:acyltransferase family protein [Hymenobacter terricola]|uniref:acyltransferase family protein n=1 Tax=Hymenobacter terricola TaxID=2819236 RepID=UPI001B3022F3|nr:acyltransferase [Hymenobacter terricola]
MQQQLHQTIKLDSSINHRSIFDNQLEGLRGLAALIVILSHIISNTYNLDPHYPLTGIWQYSPPGHISVLVFFILSGYVIGLSNSKPITTNIARRVYLKKRFVRLYPLYLVSILLSVALAAIFHQYFSFKTIGLHLIFGQVLFTPVLSNNDPLWSLSYEVVYYLLYLVLSAYQWRPGVVALACVAFSIACRFIPGMPQVLVSYSYGACFWLIGVMLSEQQRLDKPFKHGVLLSFLLLMLCYGRMNLGISLLERTNLNVLPTMTSTWFERAILFSDFSSLLFCLPLLLRFTNRTMPGLVWVEHLAFLVPGLYLATYFVSGKIHDQQLFDTVFIPTLFYAAALFIYVTQGKWDAAAKWSLTKLIPLGSISYGIYIIHFPLIMLFQHVEIFSGSSLTFLLRCSLYLGIVLAAGWFLERKFQPWAKEIIG